VLTVIAHVFDLGMSFGKVKSEKSPEKNWKNLKIYIQNCVGTLVLSVWLFSRSYVWLQFLSNCCFLWTAKLQQSPKTYYSVKKGV